MARHPTRGRPAAAALRHAVRVVANLCVVVVSSTASANGEHQGVCAMEFSRVCCESHDVVLYMGCAPTQRVPLDLGPGSFEIFVDGERVLGNPSALALRTDQTHIVFVKRAGHVSELVVLERTEDQGEPPRLVPPRIDVRLRPLLNKEVTITIDERPDES